MKTFSHSHLHKKPTHLKLQINNKKYNNNNLNYIQIFCKMLIVKANNSQLNLHWWITNKWWNKNKKEWKKCFLKIHTKIIYHKLAIICKWQTNIKWINNNTYLNNNFINKLDNCIHNLCKILLNKRIISIIIIATTQSNKKQVGILIY